MFVEKLNGFKLTVGLIFLVGSIWGMMSYESGSINPLASKNSDTFLAQKGMKNAIDEKLVKELNGNEKVESYHYSKWRNRVEVFVDNSEENSRMVFLGTNDLL